MEFAGILYGFEQGKGLSCRVTPTGSGLAIEVEGRDLAHIDYRSLEVSLSGVDDRYLTFQTVLAEKKLRLLVSDQQITSQIEATGAPRQLVVKMRGTAMKRAGRAASRWTWLAVFATAVIAIGVVAWFGFGWVMNRAVAAIPVEWEVELGRSAASELLAEHRVCSDLQLQRGVEEIGMRLVGGLGASPYSFRLRVLDVDDVNAFALPGGYLFVNRGLIDHAESGTEIAGVLAHEIQHVLGRHGIHNIVRQAGFMLLLAAVIGDAGQLEEFLLYNAAGLASMSFSRDQERAADAGGVRLMRRANFDPRGLHHFLTKLEESPHQARVPTILSTHPATEERSRALKAIISRTASAPITPLNTPLPDIRGRCAPVRLANPDAL